MNQELWFPQPIWYADNEVDFTEAIAFCKKLQANTPGKVISNRGGWHSETIDIFAHEELSAVAKIVADKTAFLASQLNKDIFDHLECTSSWININKKYSYNVRHAHPGAAFSGCIYLQVPENSGNLVFYRPDAMRYAPIPQNLYNPIFFNNTVFTPRDGFIVLFPAWLEHEVNMSEADNDRISIAFNLDIKYKEQ